jgi:hypothetical protein
VDRYISASIVLAFLVVALLLLVLGWRNRVKRQSHVPAMSTVPTVLGKKIGEISGLYVATTLAGFRLDRVAVRGLGFRSRVRVGLYSTGVVLTIPGQSDLFITSDTIIAATRSTWTIDRVVEDGGLVCLEWLLGDSRVESFFRVDDPVFFVAALKQIASSGQNHDVHQETKA